MKKHITLFVSALMIILSSLSAFASFSTEEGTQIIIRPANETEIERPHRAQESIPISAYFDGFTSTVFVSFTSNIGEVEMVIANMLTGETQYEEVDAYLAPVAVPISGTEGTYSIVFTLLDGTEYIGEFEIIGE